jgi:tryptophanyl-tRNA synthetase
VATLPELDGLQDEQELRQHHPLFVPREQLKKLIMGIVTDSRAGRIEVNRRFALYPAVGARPVRPLHWPNAPRGIAWGGKRVIRALDWGAPLRLVYNWSGT